jgi:hypothetical protein
MYRNSAICLSTPSLLFSHRHEIQLIPRQSAYRYYRASKLSKSSHTGVSWSHGETWHNARWFDRTVGVFNLFQPMQPSCMAAVGAGTWIRTASPCFPKTRMPPYLCNRCCKKGLAYKYLTSCFTGPQFQLLARYAFESCL